MAERSETLCASMVAMVPAACRSSPGAAEADAVPLADADAADDEAPALALAEAPLALPEPAPALAAGGADEWLNGRAARIPATAPITTIRASSTHSAREPPRSRSCRRGGWRGEPPAGS